jgi:hypothetical protein
MIDEASVIESFEKLERRVATIENSDMLQAVDRDVLGALSLRLTRLEDHLSKLEAQATVNTVRAAEWTPEQMAEQEARIKADRERWEAREAREENVRSRLLDLIEEEAKRGLDFGPDQASRPANLVLLDSLIKTYKRLGR